MKNPFSSRLVWAVARVSGLSVFVGIAMFLFD
jgi:hypothetical protein